ncbi:MAG TPA: peptidylprolyl isomerase [Terracidiphilus sp.]|jgi:peptidyl-prolyl cis-trans isomerase SurA|nr:peptidylprolyl isomerase [Terracidiphilus sp.]
MNLRLLCTPAAIVLGTLLLGPSAQAQSNEAMASPYGGSVVEQIVARVNDQIITNSDYDRAMKDLDQEERQRGATMQQISEAHRDLLRNLIDQQLWLSKGKELGITGETELINRLNEIRKQYHMDSLEDLEKAAEQQGVSYEDFKANIRNQIITQQVMRQEVGAHISMTPGEVRRYFEAHKQDYVQPESVQLSEILISTGDGDEKKVAAAKARAEDIENKLQAGGDFTELAKTFSNGQTANDGGSLGTYKRGELAKIFEDAVFPLKDGQFTQPIRTKQGFIIFKVIKHAQGGVPAFADVEQDVEQNYYMSKMDPAIRSYLTKMREESYIDIRSGYTDTGASPNETKPVFSAYTPPSPKKRKKVERTRFRETGHGFRQKSGAHVERVAETKPTKEDQKAKTEEPGALKPGKKEKIRFGQAPQETLPKATRASQIEDAGALPETASNANAQDGFDEAPVQEKKTRFSDRLRDQKKKDKKKSSEAPVVDPMSAPTPDAATIAKRQIQSAPLGLNGDTATKKKKAETTTSEKTRLSDRQKEEKKEEKPTGDRPLGDAPAPSTQSTPSTNPQP